MKFFLIFFITILLLVSCATEKTDQLQEQLDVATITEDAVDYVGKTVSLTGTVVHVCKHGGKRMFIIGEDPEKRFKITAGPDVGTFDIALEGSDVLVTGLLEEQRVDEAYLDNWESELAADSKPEVAHEGMEHGEEEGKEEHTQESNKQIENMRKKLAESGKEYLSFYSLKCESFKEIKS
jgi:hypothetical protein